MNKEREAEKERIVKMITGVSTKAPAKIQPYIVQAAPILATIIIYCQIAAPYVVKAFAVTSEVVSKLPENVLWAIMGIMICFFGGVFPATIAAAEAWNLCGGTQALEDIKALWIEFKKVAKASAEDDAKDDDGDGIADVNQLKPQELVGRKVALALRSIEPNSVNKSIAGIYTGWVGVLATLKIQFAKTIALATAIGDRLYAVAQPREEMLKSIVPAEYKQWVPVALKWTCKSIAISFAWWVQRIVSSIHSAIRGAFIFAEYLCKYLKEEKNIDLEAKLGPYADDVIAWSIAAMGFFFQLYFGFSVPFPFWIITWPLNITEYFVIYSVTSSTPSF